MPSKCAAGAATQTGALAVALSIVYPDDDPNLAEELIDLRRFLPGSKKCWLADAPRPVIRLRSPQSAQPRPMTSANSAISWILCAAPLETRM